MQIDLKEEFKKRFLISLIGGWFGTYYFKNGDSDQGITYVCTLGYFGVGWIYDTVRFGVLAFGNKTDDERIAAFKKENDYFVYKRQIIAQRKQRKNQFKLQQQQMQHQQLQAQQQAQQQEKQRIETLRQQGVPLCPKCNSQSIHYIENRKRLSLGRTVVGGAVGSLANPFAAVAGAAMGGLTSNKQKKGTMKCLNCGYTWKI